MNFAMLREYLLSFPSAVEERPFGPTALVYKVGGKMFALTPVEAPRPSVTLKCDPALAEHLRAAYLEIRPAYHMNKRHWNTVALDGVVSEELLREMIDDSYALVMKTLPKAAREKLKK